MAAGDAFGRPAMVRLLSIKSSLFNVMVWGVSKNDENVIVLPSQDSTIACRKDPAPLSELTVTIGSLMQAGVTVTTSKDEALDEFAPKKSAARKADSSIVV
jgi:hypothetical protein